MTAAFDIHQHSPAASRRSVRLRSHNTMPEVYLGDSCMPTEIEHISRSGAKIIAFGPFRLMPRLRLLLKRDTPVHIGSRALDLLIALTERPGELITKDELFSRVWPDTFVDPGNLSVHIMALRRILKDGCGDNRYIVNTPGRGYRFVAPVAFAPDARSTQPAAPPSRRHSPPHSSRR